MTYDSATSKEVGAPANAEMEITPAMIASGVSELVRFNPDYERESGAVVRIFEAMASARSRKNPGS